jgi:hypothetical protein
MNWLFYIPEHYGWAQKRRRKVSPVWYELRFYIPEDSVIQEIIVPPKLKETYYPRVIV